jgi:hypothetical protein
MGNKVIFDIVGGLPQTLQPTIIKTAHKQVSGF